MCEKKAERNRIIKFIHVCNALESKKKKKEIIITFIIKKIKEAACDGK